MLLAESKSATKPILTRSALNSQNIYIFSLNLHLSKRVVKCFMCYVMMIVLYNDDEVTLVKYILLFLLTTFKIGDFLYQGRPKCKKMDEQKKSCGQSPAGNSHSEVLPSPPPPEVLVRWGGRGGGPPGGTGRGGAPPGGTNGNG